MTIGIMQPYFFPYIGYYALIKHSNHFVFFDTPQFIRHGWIDRNRILKPTDSWQYIKVPIVKHPRNTCINEISIQNEILWKNRIIRQVEHYKKKAIYYKNTIDLIKEVFNFEGNSIVDLNIKTVTTVMQYLNISFSFSVFSKLNLDISETNSPDEWALNISTKLNVTTYLNPVGGLSFFDKSKYQKAGINLKFLKTVLLPYDQKRTNFEPSLSIIDVLMFNSPESIRNMLEAVEFID